MRSELSRFLDVEDDADTREIVSLALTNKDFEVIATETCEEAVRLAKAEHFDLYILETLADRWIGNRSLH